MKILVSCGHPNRSVSSPVCPTYGLLTRQRKARVKTKLGVNVPHAGVTGVASFGSSFGHQNLTKMTHICDRVSIEVWLPGSLYAMRVLRNHGLPATSPSVFFRATIIAKLIYCSPVWSGLTSAHDRARIDAFLRRSKRYGYCADSVPEVTDIFAEADQSLFRRILNNESHVLHQLLPEKTNCTYDLRSRQHNRQLTRKSTHINDSLFFIRMLYKDAY